MNQLVERLKARSQGLLRYVRTGKDSGYWIGFDGRRWSIEDGTRRAEALAHDVARSIRDEVRALGEQIRTGRLPKSMVEAVGDDRAAEMAKDKLAQLHKWAIKSGNAAQTRGMLTQAAAEMAVLPVGERAAKDSLLAMWVVGSHLDEALALGEAWGFKFVTDLFYWLKQRLIDADQIDLFTGDIPEPKISMGYHSRKQLEPCLLFKRGKGLPVLDHSVRQLILAPPREHSRKPDCQYERLTALYGDVVPRLELFARTAQPGWTAWGNQVGKFEVAA